MGAVVPLSEGLLSRNGGLTGGLSGASLPIMPKGTAIAGAPPVLPPLPLLLVPPVFPIPTTLLEAQGIKLSASHMAKFKELCKAHNLQHVIIKTVTLEIALNAFFVISTFSPMLFLYSILVLPRFIIRR